MKASMRTAEIMMLILPMMSPPEEVMFSPEEEKRYSQQFQNGYDLYDPKYMRWLSIYHPTAEYIRSFANMVTAANVPQVQVYDQPSDTNSENEVSSTENSAPSGVIAEQTAAHSSSTASTTAETSSSKSHPYKQ